jgi:G:T-mismatch repair DNA endonuclease (very short patch repair protein)
MESSCCQMNDIRRCDTRTAIYTRGGAHWAHDCNVAMLPASQGAGAQG